MTKIETLTSTSLSIVELSHIPDDVALFRSLRIGFLLLRRCHDAQASQASQEHPVEPVQVQGDRHAVKIHAQIDPNMFFLGEEVPGLVPTVDEEVSQHAE